MGGFGQAQGAQTQRDIRHHRRHAKKSSPNTELIGKGVGVDTRSGNAFLDGAVSRSGSRAIPNEEDVDPPKTYGGVGGGRQQKLDLFYMFDGGL